MLLFQRSNPEPIAASTLAVPPLPLRERQNKKVTVSLAKEKREKWNCKTHFRYKQTVLTSIHYIDLACDHLVKKLFLGDDCFVCWAKQFMNHINKLRQVLLHGFSPWFLYHLQETRTHTHTTQWSARLLIITTVSKFESKVIARKTIRLLSAAD